jgi:hypothetical protein
VAVTMAWEVSKYRWARWSRIRADLPPRDRRFGGGDVVRAGIDGFADLEQADADSVEDQPGGHVVACTMRAAHQLSPSVRIRPPD